jgi:hypothetical protein
MSAAIAAVLEQFEAPLMLRELPLPARVEPGAALVRTEMAGICGTDVHLWKGQLPIALPVILGHETVGRLEQLGDGLERDWTGQPLKRGDRVTWNSAASCGLCYYCAEKRQPTRCPKRRAYGIGYRCDQPPHLLGGYGEFHYLHPRATIFKLPEICQPSQSLARRHHGDHDRATALPATIGRARRAPQASAGEPCAGAAQVVVVGGRSIDRNGETVRKRATRIDEPARRRGSTPCARPAVTADNALECPTERCHQGMSVRWRKYPAGHYYDAAQDPNPILLRANNPGFGLGRASRAIWWPLSFARIREFPAPLVVTVFGGGQRGSGQTARWESQKRCRASAINNGPIGSICPCVCHHAFVSLPVLYSANGFQMLLPLLWRLAV